MYRKKYLLNYKKKKEDCDGLDIYGEAKIHYYEKCWNRTRQGKVKDRYVVGKTENEIGRYININKN